MRRVKTIKWEFSKVIVSIIVTIFVLLSIWSVIEYYTLIKFAAENNSSVIPDSTIAVTCISTILGTILTYCLYQGILKTSLNKNNLKIDNLTGIVSSIKEANLDSLVDSVIQNQDV